MSQVVDAILVDMDVQHVPIVPHNQEENGILKHYNGTIMNFVRAAISTERMNCSNWPWYLADANDKYNQFPHSRTVR